MHLKVYKCLLLNRPTNLLHTIGHILKTEFDKICYFSKLNLINKATCVLQSFFKR